ncbi:hypothetical protein ACFVL4_18820 [Bacillus subtilis]|nr:MULTISPECIES: hypothetical protein [Bacillus]ACJ66907.1 hypothetical protein Bsb_27 [Bacillus subtilis]MEC3664949.1 hypothetical protein [Bacillus subtilis]NUF07800.1 hypothetical protein [Bacillus rugosus]ODV48146.1 hypothetical protein BCM26_04150 [Bacillus subtilis]OJH64103.1 hypothetical protein BOH71_07145 [Bacillus subtilis]
MLFKKRTVLASLFLLAAITVLAGCNVEERSAEVNKDDTVKKYDLVWFDYLNSDSNEGAPPVKVAYMDKDKVKTKTFKDYTEDVVDIEEPYIKIKNNEVFIYRPPYLKYVQDPVEGKVKEKQVQQGSGHK